MSSGVRAFLADLAKARESQYTNISRIRRGDSDGEVSLLYSNDLLDEALEIQVLSTDLTSYPQGSSFMIFTSSETCKPNIVSLLERIASSTKGSTLQDVIETLSARLTASFTDIHSDSSDSEGLLDDVYDDEYSASSEVDNFQVLESAEESSGDDAFTEPLGYFHSAEELRRLYKDLRLAQKAGFTVGLFPNSPNCLLEAISISIRVSSLAIPSEAMSAWDVKPTDYIVLLVRIMTVYPNLHTLLSASALETCLHLRFGKCELAKPSMESMRLAFDYSPQAKEGSSTSQSTPGRFAQVYMSNSIDILLKNSFTTLLRLRREHGFTWDDAQGIFNDFTGRVASQIAVEHTNKSARHEVPISTHVPSSLQHDFALGDEANVSFPLVAMQFALRHFCKCTEYCMVCHLKLDNEFETLKPYVCSKDLCLFQYLSLGLGPNIEHEVISNPYVVDLLISFFYAGESQQSTRAFPRGLALKVPVVQHMVPHLEIETNLQSEEFWIRQARNGPEHVDLRKRIRDGDWFVMFIKNMGYVEKRICRVSAVLEDGCRFSFESINVVKEPTEKGEVVAEIDMAESEIAAQALKRSVNKTDETRRPGFIFPYEHDPGDLDGDQRALALTTLLDGMPTVLEMRDFLLAEPGRLLSSWKRMNRSALSLIRWIVASNTSYIVQDSPVTSGNPQPDGCCEIKPTSPDTALTSNMIRPLDDGWVQFRFAQGSPEKEFTFLNILRELKSKATSPEKPPSLFVWHGSPLGNWHSIIRTGLDFQDTRHGRACGNGVYFSSDQSVSMGYTGASNSGPKTPYSPVWRSSEMRIASAMSICEIVNKPEDFVCSSTCFVVDKTDWIQCRYLLVLVNPTPDALKSPLFAPSGPRCPGYLEQDPKHPIRSKTGSPPIQIPMSAISMARRQEALGATLSMSNAEMDSITTAIEDEANEWERRASGDDLNILLEAVRTETPAKGEKRERSISRKTSWQDPESSAPPYKSPKLSADTGIDDSNTTNVLAVTSDKSKFQPGTLDYTTLPRLPPPSWAASSPMALRTLNRELKQIHSIQERNEAASLGWYVDTSVIDNLFQWIVQFHSFDSTLPLAADMKSRGIDSIVLELRFGSNFPMSPPFARIIRPRFLPFLEGGGGHVTAGGAICSEMLTNSGWSPALSIESVLLQIRLGLCDTERPAKLDRNCGNITEYGIGEAIDAYARAANSHGWKIPEDLKTIHIGWGELTPSMGVGSPYIGVG